MRRTFRDAVQRHFLICRTGTERKKWNKLVLMHVLMKESIRDPRTCKTALWITNSIGTRSSCGRGIVRWPNNGRFTPARKVRRTPASYHDIGTHQQYHRLYHTSLVCVTPRGLFYGSFGHERQSCESSFYRITGALPRTNRRQTWRIFNTFRQSFSTLTDL